MPKSTSVPFHSFFASTMSIRQRLSTGMRNLYHIKLLGAHFLGDYRVQPNHQQVLSTLDNDWATAHETLNKSA